MADLAGSNYKGDNSTTGTLNGLFKEVYASDKKQLVPDGKVVLTAIKFLEKSRQPGNAYNQPVVLGLEHGVTFAGPDEGAFELNAPIAGQIKNAVVKGYQLLLRSVISYEAASRSLGGGEKAFEDGTKFLVGNMFDSVAKKLEIMSIYGQMGYAKIASAAAPVGNDVLLTIKTSEFAPGIWSGAEKMPLEVYNVNTLVVPAVVKSVDLTARTVLVTCADAPAATALKAAVDADPNILDIFHKGAKNKEFPGIHKILSNTGSLFGIDASEYALWKGSTFAPAVESVLSFALLQQAISKGVEKGLDSDVMVLVNPGHWDDLLTEQTATRINQNYSSEMKEDGHKKIKFHSQNGAVEIVPSIHVKEGYAYIVASEDWARIGSTDITFKRPGKEGEFFLDLPTHAGYELRCFTEQSVFCARPGRSILISNIKTA